MAIRERKTIGYELVKKVVYGKEYFSFRIHGPSGSIIPGMDCPLTFPTAAGAKGCAEQLIASVVEQLKKAGHHVSAHRS